MARKRVAVLISGRGSNMVALIEAAKAKDYPAEIVLVVSNRPDAAGIAYARNAGIATTIIDHTDYGKNREAFERALQAVLEGSGIEIVCLAGFMRLLTPWFIEHWEGRMLNIHPALLPNFKGLHTHEQALAAGAKIAWRDRAFRHRRYGCRPDRLSGLSAGAGRRHSGNARGARARGGAQDLSVGTEMAGGRKPADERRDMPPERRACPR